MQPRSKINSNNYFATGNQSKQRSGTASGPQLLQVSNRLAVGAGRNADRSRSRSRSGKRRESTASVLSANLLKITQEVKTKHGMDHHPGSSPFMGDHGQHQSAVKVQRKCSFDSDDYKDLLEDSDENEDSNSQEESNSVSNDDDDDTESEAKQEEDDDGLDDIDDEELANLDMEPPRKIKKQDSLDDDDELLMLCGNEDLMKQ